jgi:hypothetical protein
MVEVVDVRLRLALYNRIQVAHKQTMRRRFVFLSNCYRIQMIALRDAPLLGEPYTDSDMARSVRKRES